MTKLNSLLTVILVVSLSAVPIMYMIGMQRYSTLLDTKVEENQTQMRAEYEQILKTHELAWQVKLQEKEGEWDRQQEALRIEVRELLLNSGVTLEQLDAPPVLEAPVLPEGPNLVISQAVYEALAIGQSYASVVEALGREGENVLNMDDTAGRTSAYEWRWYGEDGEPETLTATFINGKLNHKTYSAYAF